MMKRLNTINLYLQTTNLKTIKTLGLTARAKR